jgi:hypothetical protein
MLERCISSYTLLVVLILITISAPVAYKSRLCRASYGLYANPVTREGSNYRGDISEQEAFMWFDEAHVFVRAGSGGAGAATFKFGKNRYTKFRLCIQQR